MQASSPTPREHWRAFDAEAQLLASALRSGRLTVLVGALGVGKTTLLTAGVLPLLHRRAGDEHRQSGGAPQVVVPFPDRRSRVSGRAQGELLRCVDQWNEASLASLMRSLDELPAAARARSELSGALSPAQLSTLSQRHDGARLLFVFDHFEQLLDGAQRSPDRQRFVEAWTAVVRAPLPDAHFLIAVDERAWPRVQGLRARMPRVELRAFRLQARHGERVLEALAEHPPRDSAPRRGVVDADFKQSLDAVEWRVAESVRDAEARQRNFAASLDTFVDGLGAAVVRDAASPATETPTASAEDEAERAAQAAEATPLPEPGATGAAVGLPLPAAAARPARTGVFWGASLLVVAIAAVLGWATRPTPPAAPVAAAPVATVPATPEPAAAPAAAPAAPTPAAPPVAVESGRYRVLGAPSDGTNGRIARELSAALSTDTAAMRLEPLADRIDPLTWLQAPGRLGIARLDALRAARSNGAPPLRVLTPLYAEAVLFVVSADSPLRYIHDLRGRRLSIGAVQSDASHTVREIYWRLFGTEMTEPAQLDTNQALAELVAFGSIDAMAIVEPQPLVWWASLDPKIARRLRLLTLDPRHPADRRLLNSLGTPVARIQAGAAKGKVTTTPAVMSYLVASGAADADADRLRAMARALCTELPRLRRQGHPKWRELKPTAQLDTGWPVVWPFQSALSRCVRR
jgi:hypothetical protein